MKKIKQIRDTFLPFCPPCIDEEEIQEVLDTLRSNWITTGPKTLEFEKSFNAYLSPAKALAVNSGTAALHLALVGLGIGPGDKVLTTTLTFCSGVSVIEFVGAEPILVDIRADTLNLNEELVEKALKQDREGKIKAIIPVHYAGHPCEMDSIMKIAKKYKIHVVEDAAHALASQYKGKLIGAMGNPTAFSFYVTKNITTAEGGLLAGNEKLIKRARILSLHGIDRDAWKRYSAEGTWYYEVIAAGFKYNMTDIQASLGMHQLKKLSKFQMRRQTIAKKYNQAFQSHEAIETPTALPEIEHSWHLYVLRLNLEKISCSRADFIEELKARKIGASVHYVPIHHHPYFKEKYGFKMEDFPVTNYEYERLVSIPIYPAMTDEDVQSVVDAVHDILEKYKK